MQRALIVDDSKTAQIRLKKMLGRYELEVDTALSGEDALSYLSYRTPVVIFMDHHMEGMDGFEALKIIKANPNTAMIPVIMYTAQKGDVYVGQARALGALDILSKEVIKPSNLERVLNTLKIHPVRTEAAANTAEIKAMPTRKTTPESPARDKLNDANLNQIRSQIARLFEIHIADVRTQIAENTKFIVRRLSKDIENNTPSVTKSHIDDIPASVVEQEVAAERTRLGLVSGSLLVLILLGLGWLGWLQYQTRSLLEQTPRQASVNVPGIQNAELSAATNEIFRLREELGALEDNQNKLLSIITWALDTDLNFDYAQIPFGETQVNRLFNLVYMLDSIGFSGDITLDVNYGDYCLRQDTNGAWTPASDGTPGTDCILLSELNLGLLDTDPLSIEFLNFEQSAAPLIDGRIQLNVSTAGTDSPRYPYPQNIASVSAYEWNRIASANNRISLRFP